MPPVFSTLRASSGLPLQELLLLVAVLAAVAALVAVSRSASALTAPLRERFVAGVPWGTLVVCGLLLTVYYVVQDGFSNTTGPVVLPFRAWSYFDPVGMLLAGFSHANLGHLTGNLLGTLLLGSLAEYWWGHYTDDRSTHPPDHPSPHPPDHPSPHPPDNPVDHPANHSPDSSAADPTAPPTTHSTDHPPDPPTTHSADHPSDSPLAAFWTHPVARAVVIFPVATVLVGIVGTLLALGPIIGFSTVVFAFAGFALVRHPLGVIVVGVGQGVLRGLLDALRFPQQVAVAETAYSTPWFANIAVQGHAVGLLMGIFAGLAVLWLRDESPPPAVHVWAGVLLFAVSRSLWAIYWFRGNETYVLYRAVGLAAVFVLVAVVTVTVVARHRPLFPARADDDPGTITAALNSITGREVGLLLLVAVAAAVVGPAIPVNLTTAADAELPGDPIEINGYEITYGENVPNGQLRVVPSSLTGESTQLNTSGVIVRNQDRHIWSTEVSTGELAADGGETVRIGGLGWQDSVSVERTGWRAVGGQSAYRVSLAHANETRPVFASGPATAEPVVAGRRLSINATETAFFLSSEPVETINASNTVEAVDTSETTNSTGPNSTETNSSDIATTDSERYNPIVLRNVPETATKTATVRIPDLGASATLGPIRIVNRGDQLFAVYRGTVVRIAQRE